MKMSEVRRACRNILSATPPSAPAQIRVSISVDMPPVSSSTQNGVYVPAMKMKIIEWSRRRMTW